jgi:hypothetical protein
MTDKIPAAENAGPEIDGQKFMGWKMQDSSKNANRMKQLFSSTANRVINRDQQRNDSI